MTQKINTVGGRWAVVIVVLAVLGLISFISAIVAGIFLSTSEVEEPGNVAHIKLNGVIVTEAPTGFMSSGMVDSTSITKLIEKAASNDEIKAILLEINSPGGSAVASYEIAEALKKSNKTTAAWIREVGASGGYWIASTTDHIVANPMSITGSVGVISSYIEFWGTLERYNASYRRLVAGEYKDMGTPLKEMTSSEEELLQERLDLIHEMFIDEVAKNRKLNKEKIEEISTAKFYLGKQAVELGLVDELGGKEEAIRWLAKKEGIEVVLSEYKKPKTLAEIISGVFSEGGFSVGQGIGRSLVDERVENRAGIVV